MQMTGRHHTHDWGAGTGWRCPTQSHTVIRAVLNNAGGCAECVGGRPGAAAVAGRGGLAHPLHSCAVRSPRAVTTHHS